MALQRKFFIQNHEYTLLLQMLLHIEIFFTKKFGQIYNLKILILTYVSCWKNELFLLYLLLLYLLKLNRGYN